MTKQDKGVEVVKRDGIAVEVDLHFMRSWDGIVLAADMQSDRLDDADRFGAMVAYYRAVCPNIDEVNDALVERDAGTEATDLMQFVAGCVKEVTSKN